MVSYWDANSLSHPWSSNGRCLNRLSCAASMSPNIVSEKHEYVDRVELVDRASSSMRGSTRDWLAVSGAVAMVDTVVRYGVAGSSGVSEIVVLVSVTRS